MTNRRVLVTGGAGFLGAKLVETLLAEGFSVVSLDKDVTRLPPSISLKSVVGDIRDLAIVRSAAEGCFAIIHCAAALPLHSPSEIWGVEVEGTRNVVEAAIGANVKRLIHLSSTAVYGRFEKVGQTEDGELLARSPYGLAKIKSEQIVEASRPELASAILRPQTIIGPGRLGLFSLLFDWAYHGRNFPILGKGMNRQQFIDVDDVITAIILCLSVSTSKVSTTFNLGAKEFGSFREDIQALLDFCGHKKAVISIPQFPLVTGLLLLSKLRLSPIYPWVLETAVRDNVVSIRRAEERLGWSPAYSNREALVRNYLWYSSNLDSFEASRGKTHNVPWKQGMLRLARWLFR